MKSPYTGKEMKLHREQRNLTFRKNEFTIVYHSYYCEESNEYFETDELSEINIKQVHNQYREKYKLPFTSEIKATREKYGLSARKISEILGFGVNTYSNYENGDIPETTNGRLIQLANDPKQFRELARKADLLDTKLDHRILLLEKKGDKCLTIWNILFNSNPCKRNGYKRPDKIKAFMAIRFFADKLSPWKTKMNKLLFYADFLNYRENSESITGLSYCAIPHGPVLDNYNIIFGMASNEGYIDIREQINAELSGELFFSSETKLKYEDVFSDSEFCILNEVAKRFSKYNAKEIADLSHQEPAWIENHKSRSFIDYDYSYKLVSI